MSRHWVASGGYSQFVAGATDSKIMACVQVEKDCSNSHIGMLAVRPALQDAVAGKQMLFQAERYAFDVFGAENYRGCCVLKK